MKTAIIILAVLTCVSFLTWKLIGLYISNDKEEAVKAYVGWSKLALVAGIGLVLSILCGLALLVLLLIYFL